MARYESSLIHQFADRLYRKASSTIAAYTALFALIGFGVGLAYSGPAVGLIAAALLGVIGCVLGSEKAFQLKLLAQMALCQARIEENTRGRYAPSALLRPEERPRPIDGTRLPAGRARNAQTGW
jgi:hypothetical protein